MDVRSAIADSILTEMPTTIDFANAKSSIILILRKYNITEEIQAKNDLTTQISRFLSAKRIDGASERTSGNYRQQLFAWAKFTDKAIANVTTNDIRDYLSCLQTRGLKESSIGTIINTLRSFFTWLITEEIIEKNPMARIKPVNIDKMHLRHALSVEDIEKFRNHCIRLRDKVMFELFYSTGCRLSELVNIDVRDIDFQNRSIRLIGKGNKERTVFFSYKAKIYIEQYLKTRKGQSEALFISYAKPYNRIKTRTIQDAVTKIGREASIADVTPHIFRHSFADHAYNGGMEITVVQKLLGHTDLKTTQIYATTSMDKTKYQYNQHTF